MREFSRVTFTTEYGENSPYAAVLKGEIWKRTPDVQWVDISNQVIPNDILAAAYLLRTTALHFPPGTIHLVAVDVNLSTYKQLLIAHYRDQFFVSADNGIFSILFQDEKPVIYAVNQDETLAHHPFPESVLFPIVVENLLLKRDWNTWTSQGEMKTIRKHLTPVAEHNQLKGSILFIDGYQNVITDITEKEFNPMVAKWKKFEILYRRRNGITKISQGYNSEKQGDILALFNSFGYLELAIRDGNAQSLLGLKVGGTILIEFND